MEFEYSIPKEDAMDMFHYFCGSNVINKTRHYVKDCNHTCEIDEFHGQNDGLIVAEIELKSESELFNLPPWAGIEVSEDSKYYNMNLCKDPYKNWVGVEFITF